LSITVRREPDPVRKRELQSHLAGLLPDWFGKADANTHYTELAASLEGYVAEIDGLAKGLLLLKWTSPASAEIYWMGVDPAFHRRGLGRALVHAAAADARARGRKYLALFTLHPGVPYEPYQRTRRFYEGLGFDFVLDEQFPADPGNPLAIYLKALAP